MIEELGHGVRLLHASYDLQPKITHRFEAIQNRDGSFAEVRNYYSYEFSGLPDAAEVGATVLFGERMAHITGLSPTQSPKSAELLIEYFRSRMFESVECLSPDPAEVDPIKGYQTIWTANGQH